MNIADHGYRFSRAIESVEGPIVLGTLERAPTTEEVMEVIGKSDKSCVVSLFAAKPEEQPVLFSKLYSALQNHRVHTGWAFTGVVAVALPRSSRASTDTTGRPLVFQATVPGLYPLCAA